MNRLQKLEEALRAATKLRRAFDDYEPAFDVAVPRAAVVAYDAKIKELSDDKDEAVQDKAVQAPTDRSKKVKR